MWIIKCNYVKLELRIKKSYGIYDSNLFENYKIIWNFKKEPSLSSNYEMQFLKCLKLIYALNHF